jgi:hypothetical protein
MLHSPKVHPFLAPLAVRSARVASDEDRPDWLGVPAITWLLVISALLVPGGGVTAMAVFDRPGGRVAG